MPKSATEKRKSRKPASKSLDFSALSLQQLDDLTSLPDVELAEFIQTRIRGTRNKVRFIEVLKAHKGPKQRCEESLHCFMQEAFRIVVPGANFVDGEHIRGICLHLEAVLRGEIKNLLINIPPGCMKSLLCNVFFPAWCWATNPSLRFLHATYGEPLSIRDSILCRSIVESQWYKDFWGDKVQIATEQNQKLRFDTTAKGWRIATTVHGRGTGEHPNFLIADDVLSAQDASSEAERKYVNEQWWDGAMSTRGMGIGSARIVIGQRLHESDLPGHIINRGGYDHILLPMEFEPGRMKTTSIGWDDWRTTPGQLVWPEFIPRAVVEEKKISLGPWQAPGQFQQRPTRQGGGVIQTDKLQIVDALPNDCVKFVRYYDKAATLGSGDYTAGALVTYSFKMKCCYVVDMVHGQWDYEARNNIMDQTAKLDADNYGLLNVLIRGEQEGGSGGKESAQISMKRMAKYNVVFEKPTGDKIDRAGPFAGQVNAGNVKLLSGVWNSKFIQELSVFPVGDHDDQVDAVAAAYNHLQNWLGFNVHTGRNPIIELEPPEEEKPPEIELDLDDPDYESHRLSKVLQEVGFYESEDES